MTVEQWRAGILSFESRADVENPFLDVTITARFTGPSGRVISREAYWDGGDTYRVSFAPTEVGQWRYVLEAPEETGLNGETGTLTCVPYTGDLPIYKYGFLKIAGRGGYIAYDDDTPFFWLGDTHWGFVSGERWSESNHPKMDSMFRDMVDRRCNQGFTVYQTNLRPEPGLGNTHYWEDGKEGLLPDVQFYRSEVDKRMKYIADKGLVNALGFAWFMSALKDPQAMKNLARYTVARYGAYPIVWTLAGEVAGYYPGTRKACIDAWREIALLVEQWDGGYHTLQTAHYTNERPFPDYYQDETWFDFTLNQAGHGDYVISGRDYFEHRKNHPSKPFIEGESMYEFVWTMEENGGRIADPAMVRHAAYTAMQCGACGYTYGAQGIWDTVWEKDPNNEFIKAFNPHGVTWYEAVDGPAADQMGYLRAFYERCGFQELAPFPACFQLKGAASESTGYDLFKPCVTANGDMSTVVLYFPPQTRSFDAEIRYLKNKPYSVSWFDPRNNAWLPVEEAIVPQNGRYALPRRPDLQDWLMVLTCKTN